MSRVHDGVDGAVDIPYFFNYLLEPIWAISSVGLERTVHIREVIGSSPISPTSRIRFLAWPP